MNKPRVIVADTDVNYILSLQHKFIEEYFDEIDLEVITEKRYFEQLFGTPQRADILIVSEEMYTPEIQKHNISNVFALNEQPVRNVVAGINITPIYKYSSIKEVYSAIVGKGLSFQNKTNSQKSTQVILVYSGCGGVGKTTVALGMSAYLSRNHKRALYINAGCLQSFQALLDNASPIASAEVYSKLSVAKDNLYFDIKQAIRNEGFNYLPPFRAALMSLGISYSVFEKIALSAKESQEYDYIIMDADTTFNEDKTRLIDIADKVIIVTKPSKASVYATNILISNINGTNSEKYIFICNDFSEENTNMLVKNESANKFAVSSYINHFHHYEQLKAMDLAEEYDIQKVGYLLL